MNFKDVALVLDAIEQEPGRTKMTHLMADLLRQADPAEVQIIAYIALGSLLPSYVDKTFNFSTKYMLQAIADSAQVPFVDAEQMYAKKGDIGLVAAEFIQHIDHGLSLEHVYKALLNLTQITGSLSSEKKQHALQEILALMDETSAKFMVRMVTKTLRLGFSDMSFLDALSWMQTGDKSLSPYLQHAYNICADIGLVAFGLKKYGIEYIKTMKIHIGIPIRPAAAERLENSQAILNKLGVCIAQPKLDGFRVQIHMKKDKDTSIHFFSRNLLDMSAMFPDLARAVEKLEVESIIFEGEAIVYDESTQSFLPFQQTVKRKRKHGIEQAEQEFPLRLYIFDLLYLNGISLLDQTHQRRREIIESVFRNNSNGPIYIIDERKIENVDQLDSYFLESIGSGLEGLVVKKIDSVYQPGKRNFSWIKLKKESYGKLIDSIDVVILGYYFGQGKRAQFGIGSFLVGIFDADHKKFVTIAKIGTGLCDADWYKLKEMCDAVRVHQKPVDVICHQSLVPDVWIKPEIVCTVQAEQITLSPVHSAQVQRQQVGYALRFPRFMNYRSDKSIYDITTLQEIDQLYDMQRA